MKKNLLVLLSLVCAMQFVSLKADAQAQDWFVRLGASANYYWGDDDCTVNPGRRISPSFNLTLGKWFNPYWGVQLGAEYGKIKGAAIQGSPNVAPYYTADGLSPYTTGEACPDDCTRGELGKYGKTYLEKFSFLSIHPEVVYNVSNGMCGYNPNRVWNMLVHVGPGFAHSWANGQSANSFLVTAGLTSTWRLCRNVQLWASARMNFLGEGFDKVTYREGMDGMGSISAGVSVNFGK